MAVGLYTFVDLYGRLLDTAAHILVRGAEHAQAQGVAESEMLDWRLIDDMQPLRFQIMVVCDFARQWPARAAGLPVPDSIGADITLARFQAEIAGARAWLGGLGPELFAGRDEVLLTVEIASGGMEPTLSVERWITVFASTNLYFHLTVAFAILRARGVPIGKIDLFASGL